MNAIEQWELVQSLFDDPRVRWPKGLQYRLFPICEWSLDGEWLIDSQLARWIIEGHLREWLEQRYAVVEIAKRPEGYGYTMAHGDVLAHMILEQCNHPTYLHALVAAVDATLEAQK